MVDPNDIKFSADLVSEKFCQNIGVIHDNVFTLMDLQMNDLRVSSNEDKKDIEVLKAKMSSFISLNSLLKASDSIDYNAFDPENEEDKMYADMARTAEEEGFLALAAQFEGVAKIEKTHEERYLKLLSTAIDQWFYLCLIFDV